MSPIAMAMQTPLFTCTKHYNTWDLFSSFYWFTLQYWPCFRLNPYPKKYAKGKNGNIIQNYRLISKLAPTVRYSHSDFNFKCYFNRSRFKLVIILPVTLTITGLSFIIPKLNAFFLMFLAAPAITMLVIGYRRFVDYLKWVV